MHILFLSTLNFVTNPRFTKEIKTAISKGYTVEIICFEFLNWSKKYNDEVIADLRIKAKLKIISAERKPFSSWLISTLVQKIAEIFVKIFPNNIKLISYSLDKRSYLLKQALKGLKSKPNLVVTHNPGTFYPAYYYTQKNKIPLGIDIEDYHPGETNEEEKTRRTKDLCSITMSKSDYLSAGSTLILEKIKSDIGNYSNPAFVVENCFSKEEFTKPVVSENDALRLVWFSQNINYGRGLEQIVPVVESFENIELHIYGNLKTEFYNNNLKDKKNIVIHEPLQQNNLHKALSLYDIGLAIEPFKDLNNSIAVSNKIVAYYQAGLYIIASNTPGQAKWLKDKNAAGEIVDLNNANSLKQVISNCIDNKKCIKQKRENQYIDAQSFCWEEESKKLTSVWNQLAH